MKHDNLLTEQDNKANHIPTLNKMGFMTTVLDEFSEHFIQMASKSSSPNLEVGTAYGVTSLKALSRGAHIIANDIDAKHLSALKAHCPKEYLDHLTLLPGNFPEDIHLSASSLASILICRVLHFFDGKKIVAAIKKAYHLLSPGGKIFVVAETPYLKHWRTFIPIYEKRKNRGELFPGLVTDLSIYVGKHAHSLPDLINFLDQDILARILTEQGFWIEKINYINRKHFPAFARLDGRESVGAIAVKPLQISQ